MTNDFEFSDSEKLKAENTFIKMKLMLEHGARFGPDNPDLPPELEHVFLKKILEFENQRLSGPKMTVFEKIGKPRHFKPVQEVPVEIMEKAWEELEDWLLKHGVDLQVCSPRISPRELYRFATEELFQMETENTSSGFIACYIYDEFHPDPVYESEKTLREVFFPSWFNTEPIGPYYFCVCAEKIRINQKNFATADQLREELNRFKSFYEMLELADIRFDLFHVDEDRSVTVNAHYKAMSRTAGDHALQVFKGECKALLVPDEVGYWQLKSLDISGVDL